MTDISRGTLFLIVGPSGAGKDSLLGEIKPQLAADFLIARRVIARLNITDLEPYEGVTADEFRRRLDADEFMLHWRAHETSYAIPRSYSEHLNRGKHVIANVSRQIATSAAAKFPPAKIILITAPPDILKQRLEFRARESSREINTRLERTLPVSADVTLVNDGPLEETAKALLKALQC